MKSPRKTIYEHIKAHVSHDTPLCADALPQHHIIAYKLELTLKERTTTADEHVLGLNSYR